MRRICYDTETTGLSWRNGDRVCEIGALQFDENFEVVDQFHVYLNPEHPVGFSFTIHGLSDDFLSTQPRFAAVADAFLSFVDSAELIAHNNAFDSGFIDRELGCIQKPGLRRHNCTLTCSLQMARRLYPGQKNSLTALCSRFGIDQSHRTLHGALLDSRLLLDVYRILSEKQLELDARTAVRTPS